ncbi:3'(2'),5'-bisphosphate nucleotidase [Halorhodospira abdelmalekii]|nr:3'(2'),5'-bisphosphate nucleotidase CysQ [Halorhodospira abdelmalekii]MBK1735545.1 3'(2'),5'-bisphosphate nucleotidase [Halorhodospira abdelmalekii]
MAPVRRIAEAAGERILEIYRSGEWEVSAKPDETPLTRADRAAHEVIAAGLRELTPELPQLSEEGDEVNAQTRRQWSSYWLIDPLDGTREFIKRNGEFTVNIALISRGVPVLGAVHAPDLGVSWAASAPGPAYRFTACHGEELGEKQGEERGEERGETIQTRRARPPLTVVVSRSHLDPAVAGLLERLGEHRALSVGSSLKICRVAEGSADLYPRFGPTSEWDTAAAHCVLEAAGGRMVDVGLAELRYNSKQGLLNPDFLAVGDPEYAWAELTAGLPWERRLD